MPRRILAFGLAAAFAVSTVALAQIATGVPGAQPRVDSPPNVVAHGFRLRLVAEGTDRLENPSGSYTRYGYLDDHSNEPSGLDTKTEPDENTYLSTRSNPGGPKHGYDYGHHFLVQGHELSDGHAYLTRINLDVRDPAHRITRLNDVAPDGTTGLSSIDGSAYEPFSKELLFTQEAGSSGGVVATPFRWKSTAIPSLEHLDGSFGKGGYEGIHPDDRGNVYVVEDSGGPNVPDNGAATKVRQPNSFVYRFKPTSSGDLEHGRLQALQVLVDKTPITFHPEATDPLGMHDDAFGEPIRLLHSGESLSARWVTLHDTASDGTAAFDANALAKSAGATPLKRPENGQFVPDTDFRSFVFTETGDTNRDAGNYPGAADRGAWGAILRIDMRYAGSDRASVRTIENGDATHASFDNLAFLDEDTLLVGEDRGDTLHQQLNTLDSLWSFDPSRSIDSINSRARRLLAEGRDPQATIDVANHEATPPVPDQNEGDNEVTGVHVSDGSTSVGGIVGEDDPAELRGVRAFFTQQHGENVTYEILSRGEH